MQKQLEVDALVPSGEAVDEIFDRLERLVAEPQRQDRSNYKTDQDAYGHPDAEKLAGMKTFAASKRDLHCTRTSGTAADQSSSIL